MSKPLARSARTATLAPDLRKPKRDARIIRARAEGKSYAAAAAEAGCSEGTAFNVAKAHEEYVAEQRRRFQMKVLEGLDAPVRARVKDAANPDSRTGAASFRELREVLGWVPKAAEVNIGDVNIDGSVHVSADVRVLVANATDPEELRRRAEECRARLGF